MFKNIINIWFTVVLTLFFPLKESVILKGELYTKENWAFIARFCFLPNIGKLAYTIEYDEKKYATQYLLLYYDTPEQWASAYKPGLGCKQREDFCNETNRVPLHPHYTKNCTIIKKNSKREMVSCSLETNFNLARRRWWYIAASHCNSSVGLYLKFKLRMTNGNEGDFWHEHFSADELYILPILMSFFVAYVFLIVAVGFCTVELKSRKMYHATYKLFVASVVLQETGISIQTIVYIKHALNGRGISKIRTLGRLLEAISETIFLLLLLLLAKGFTVTRGRLRLASTVKLTVFMCLYTVSYLVIFIYERLFFDPGKVLYLYESPPGYGLIILRILAWWIFVYSIVFTLRHYPEKAVFYYPFNILGTLWFVSGPTFILITNSFIDKWVRESVVCGVLHFITLCGHLQFLFLTLPTTANKVFPYKVRTSQVAAMQDADPDGTLPFSHHVYAPSAPLPPTLIPAPDRPELGPQPLQADWTTNVPVELFCISRTVDSRTETIIPLKPLGSNAAGIGNHIRTSSLSSEENDSVPTRTRSNAVRIHPVKAKIVDGELNTYENWAFIERFCFLSAEGKFEYLVEYEKTYAVQKLLLYYDTFDQWASAYFPGLSCEQRESLAKMSRKQIVNLTDQVSTSGCETIRTTGQRYLVRCHESRRFSSARQRWWFIAVSNCNSSKGLNLKYRFWMTNGPTGDFWHEHFSADEFYILPILITFCILYIIIILAAIACAVELKHRHLLHSTYKLFMISAILQECGIILQCSAYIKYGLDGIGSIQALTLEQCPMRDCFGECTFAVDSNSTSKRRLSASASEAVFLLLLLLLAKGFTVTRGRLRLASGVKLTLFMCLYCITYCAIFVYERLFFDPGKVLYLYESPAGYALIVLRGTAWAMFIYAVIFTLQHYPEKSNFYYPFNLLGTLWFVAGPALIMAATVFVDHWVRESIVCGALHTVALLGHALFLFMTMPARSNKLFPYHVRTTQIDVMRVSEPDTTLPFSRRPYEPSAPSFSSEQTGQLNSNDWINRRNEVPLELFTVDQATRRTDSNSQKT